MQRCIIHPPKCCVFIFIYVIYLPETQNCTAVNAEVYSPESYRKRVFMLTETVSLPGAWRFIYLQDSDTSVMCQKWSNCVTNNQKVFVVILLDDSFCKVKLGS